jgi:murein DD-endopeptidase MepM/ murein hydrolase activator NlpD
METGHPIGLQGATGKTTGEHLHFEVKVDPMIFFAPPLGMGLAEWRGLLR